MPSLYASVGPLPSSKALKAVSQEDVRRFYYQTQTMRDFPGKQPCQEVVGENFYDVHGIGKRTTRYMEFQLNTAPLLNRSSCKHTQDFTPLPLGDCQINKDLAKNFKGGVVSGKAAGTLAPMEGVTKYEADFHSYETEQMALAKQKNQKPQAVLTYTVCPPGDLTETISHEQSKFITPNAVLAKPTKVLLPKPGIPLNGHATAAQIRPKTHYHREYCGEAAAAVQRSLLANRSASILPPKELCPKVPEGLLDESYFALKRAPNLRPGQ